MRLILILRNSVLAILLATTCHANNSYHKIEGESGCSFNSAKEEVTGNYNLPEQNLLRAMELADAAIASHFTGNGMAMARFFNPFTGLRSDETGSIWMYTSAIEAVNAILSGLKAQNASGESTLYDENFKRYSDLLYKLYDNADYYLGTFRLVSYTQTKEWSVYGVHRGVTKGSAKVAGIENVYDDQMWFVRELLESYKLTGNDEYLQKAEYLTDYVLDGWDCTRDSYGQEMGGITWGPGYVSKHACSNGPMVSPLVWLHELYKHKNDKINRRYIDANDKKTRKTILVNKSDYYLDFAQKVYQWQKKNLLRSDEVYADMMGGCTPGKPQTEAVNGEIYRKGINCSDPVGKAYSYNSGTMLSGGTDLYLSTGDGKYLDDVQKLSDASFTYFARYDATIEGYYTYPISGFNIWFNGVLMRGYADAHGIGGNVIENIESFQKNLDYAYDNFMYKGFLPGNLLGGWNSEKSENNTEAMFNFAFAAEYAILSKFEIQKQNK